MSHGANRHNKESVSQQAVMPQQGCADRGHNTHVQHSAFIRGVKPFTGINVRAITHANKHRHRQTHNKNKIHHREEAASARALAAASDKPNAVSSRSSDDTCNAA